MNGLFSLLGKGMYTRLYTNVLNHYHWMYSCTAQNHAYADTGFFTITASGPPRQVRILLNIFCRSTVLCGNVRTFASRISFSVLQVGQIASLVIDEFIKLATAGYGETEFKRAKKQLQVSKQRSYWSYNYICGGRCKNLAFSPVNAPDELGIATRGIRGSGTAGLVQWRAKTTRILHRAHRGRNRSRPPQGHLSDGTCRFLAHPSIGRPS